MEKALAPFAKLLSDRLKYVKKIDDITIDNKVFQLHYRVTFPILILMSAVLTISMFFGQTIMCIKQVGDNKNEQKVVDNYCWIEGTFTLPRAVLESMENEVDNIDPVVGEDIAYPGVEQYKPMRSPPDEIIDHAYYQWVSIVIFFQGLAFYVTHILWKRWEGGKQKNIVDKLFLCVYKKKEDLAKHQKSLVEYLYRNRGGHSSYAFRFLLCEVINVVHVFLQIAYTDWFLGGYFWSYGYHVMVGTRPDPMMKIFPKLTKCTFSKFGPSGDVQKHDNLCLLPLNIMNEKGYLFLWFWFWFLVILSISAVIFKVVVIGFPRSRYFLLHSFNRLVPDRDFITVLNHVSYGDWFLLYLLSKNLDPFHYRDVITSYARRLEMGGPSRSSSDGKEANADEVDIEKKTEESDV